MLVLFRIGNRLSFVVISFVALIFFSACSDRSENESILLIALEESLTNSNRTINKSTESLSELLTQKLADPVTAYQAQRWQPKALEVRKLTADIYNYIDNLKADLNQEAGIISNHTNNKFSERNSYAVSQQSITRKKGKELFGKMSQYKKDILSIDLDSKEVFQDVLLVATWIDSLDMAKQNMHRIFFENASVIASLVALSQFQNNIKNIENRMVQFFVYKIPSGCILSFDVYSVIVGQNSSYLRRRHEMSIMAGVGAFSKAAKPEIAFSGKTIPIDESGVAIYRFKASGNPGKYIVPVKITYIDQEGREQILSKDVKYTVAQD